MLLWVSWNFCPLNLLLVRSHQVEVIILKRLTQARNNMTRTGVEPRSCDQGCRKNDAFPHLATLPTKLTCPKELALFSTMVSVEMKEEMRMSILNYKDTTITTRTGLEFGEYGKPCLSSIPENKASLLNLIGPDSFKFFTIWYAIFCFSHPSRRMDQKWRFSKHETDCRQFWSFFTNVR